MVLGVGAVSNERGAPVQVYNGVLARQEDLKDTADYRTRLPGYPGKERDDLSMRCIRGDTQLWVGDTSISSCLV